MTHEAQTPGIQQHNPAIKSIINFNRWMRIKFECNSAGMVAVKTIVKTFAAGKTEKIVSQALAECELPSEKVKSLLPRHLKLRLKPQAGLKAA